MKATFDHRPRSNRLTVTDSAFSPRRLLLPRHSCIGLLPPLASVPMLINETLATEAMTTFRDQRTPIYILTIPMYAIDRRTAGLSAPMPSSANEISYIS